MKYYLSAVGGEVTVDEEIFEKFDTLEAAMVRLNELKFKYFNCLSYFLVHGKLIEED